MHLEAQASRVQTKAICDIARSFKALENDEWRRGFVDDRINVIGSPSLAIFKMHEHMRCSINGRDRQKKAAIKDILILMRCSSHWLDQPCAQI